MARIVLILGESGNGKSHSIKSLDPTKTFLINVIGKDLPFKGWKKDYTPYEKTTKTGNAIITHSSATICSGLKNVVDKLENINNVVIDDFQYIMSYEFMRTIKQKGYEKFNDIADAAFSIIQAAQLLRDDITVFFLAHSEEIFTEAGRKTKIKTIGKLLDDKITIEGLFTVVLLSRVEITEEGKVKGYFVTQSDGASTMKSPEGMFDLRIDNSLELVLSKIEEYNIG